MSNCAWRLNNKYGMAYLEDRKLVAEILELEGSQSRLDQAVTATYLSPAGKPFAWQVRFSIDNWDRVSRALGLETTEKKPVRQTSKEKPRPTRQPKSAKVTSPAIPRRGRSKGT